MAVGGVNQFVLVFGLFLKAFNRSAFPWNDCQDFVSRHEGFVANVKNRGFHELFFRRKFMFCQNGNGNERGIIMKRIIFGFVIGLIVGVLVGCGGTPKKKPESVVRQMPSSYAVQKPVVVKTSKEDLRPAWTKKSVYMDDGNIYFSGGFLNGADYPLSVRCANAEALKSVVGAVSQWIRAEFTGYVQGSNKAGEGLERYVEDGIATFTKALHIQGIKQSEVYYEEVAYPGRTNTGFNVFVQLTMERSDYVRAKAEAVERMKDGFDKDGNVEAKKKAEMILDSLKREVI
jgi:hypothetical protein